MITDAVWFTSSYSGAQSGGGNCVAGARLPHATMAVRDTKDPAGPACTFAAPAWAGFLAALKQDTFPTD